MTNRKELIERLDPWIKELNRLRDFTGDEGDKADDHEMLELLEDCRAALSEDQWISVGEPPEPGASCWVSYQFGQTEAWYVNGEYWLRNMIEVIPGVTHYKPLPFPPPPGE